MGCAASSQRSAAVVIKSSNSTTNGHSHHKNGKIIKECIDPETGEKEPCNGSGPTPLIKTNSLTINDKSEQHARTGEEPAHPLPEGDYGDMRLGLTVSMKYSSLYIPHFGMLSPIDVGYENTHGVYLHLVSLVRRINSDLNVDTSLFNVHFYFRMLIG